MAISVPIRVATLFLVCLSSRLMLGQSLKPRPPAESQKNKPLAILSPVESVSSASADPVTMPMSIAAGVPIKIALDSEVRVRNVGQPIRGKTVEPVYAFDKQLIPLGAEVSGKMSAIDSVPARTRLLDATDGNFSPVRQVHVQFDELVMRDGSRIELRSVTSPAPDGVLQFEFET